MKFMAINAVTDLRNYLFFLKKDIKIILENSLTSLLSAFLGKNYPNGLIALIHFRMQH